MSRSIRVPASARRRVLTAVGIGLAMATAGTGCAAGQITQTAQQVPAVDGAHGTVGPIALRAVKLQYPQGGRYQEGQSARLTLTIANQSLEDDTLIAVRTDAASGTTFALGSSLSASASGSPSTSATESGSGSTAPTESGSSSATASPSPSESSAAGGATSIPIPANRSVLAFADGPVITLVGLKQSLFAAQVIKVTFSFQKAGDITLSVPVGVPLNEVPKPSPIDISPTTER